MKIKELTRILEKVAPPQYQEGYDNAGLIVGSPMTDITGVLVCLDATEAVILEAIERGCNIVVAHHPIVFKSLKKLNGKNYVERTVILAIKNDVAIYAIHTNLDNMLHNGVNTKIAEKLGLTNLKILAPKRQILMKLTNFVPIADTQKVLDALYKAGAGEIGNYRNCSFRTEGIGTFKPTGAANPYIGTLEKDEEVVENRIEVIFPSHLERSILTALRAAHPYEEVAYYMQTLENDNQEVGAGIVGELAEPMTERAFLQFLKTTMKAGVVRFTHPLSKNVKKIAVCGGAGSFFVTTSDWRGCRCLCHGGLQIP
ncbi:MAG: Nif3-like dinuclear metal center hexameric protein [Saprospiraceae bacterium]|nr:Nif3-like dinuclear metal center hexameric protein [Saprospiraceae bacterium]